MTRAAPVLLSALFLTLVFAAIPAQATHEYGHQFMVTGRIIGPDGEPAQQIPLRLTVETTKQRDPFLTIRTDCYGFFYSRDDPGPHEADGEDFGLESGVMHIHTGEYRTRGEYHIITQYGNYSERVDPNRQSAVAKFQLDSTPPTSQVCEDEGLNDFEDRYIVTGRLQREVDTTREDLRSYPDRDEIFTVTATIETADGPVTRSGNTTGFADYIIQFEGIDVSDGDKVTVSWDDVTETGEVDTKYQMTALHILKEEPAFSDTARNVFLGVVGAAIVIGLGVWGYSTAKDKAELRKAQERSGRKRANK